jgi:hypothetical protein
LGHDLEDRPDVPLRPARAQLNKVLPEVEPAGSPLLGHMA